MKKKQPYNDGLSVVFILAMLFLLVVGFTRCNSDLGNPYGKYRICVPSSRFNNYYETDSVEYNGNCIKFLEKNTNNPVIVCGSYTIDLR